MKYLLDTYAFIWFSENDEKLSKTPLKLIEHPSNQVYLSIASIWEMAKKIQIGKLKMNMSIAQIIDSTFQNGFNLLPVSPEHIIALTKLELFHRDPFDRILISQSVVEDCPIIGKDTAFDAYKIKRIWN